MIFQCPKCGFKLPMESHEFPLHCVCGHISKDANGLGDKVALAFDLLGVTKMVEYIKGGECAGCKERQAALNELGEAIGL